MKLFFSPGACCMSCHIILEETKTPFELVYVGKNADEKTRADFLALNPLGAVPTLQLDNGKVLTQNIAILTYLADQHPESHLLGKLGSYERATVMSWLSLIASDLHKSFGPLFRMNSITQNDAAKADIQKWAFSMIDKYFSLIDAQLQKTSFIAGDHFTVADAYLFTVYNWSKPVKFPTEKFTALNAYAEKIAKMPSVIAVHQRENQFH